MTENLEQPTIVEAKRVGSYEENQVNQAIELLTQLMVQTNQVNIENNKEKTIAEAHKIAKEALAGPYRRRHSFKSQKELLVDELNAFKMKRPFFVYAQGNESRQKQLEKILKEDC